MLQFTGLPGSQISLSESQPLQPSPGLSFTLRGHKRNKLFTFPGDLAEIRHCIYSSHIVELGRFRTMSKDTAAVLIADVVKSSAREELRGLLGAGIAHASREHLKRKWIRLPYSVTAGDEFQTISLSPESIPEVILDLRVRLQPLQL